MSKPFVYELKLGHMLFVTRQMRGTSLSSVILNELLNVKTWFSVVPSCLGTLRQRLTNMMLNQFDKMLEEDWEMASNRIIVIRDPLTGPSLTTFGRTRQIYDNWEKNWLVPKCYVC